MSKAFSSTSRGRSLTGGLTALIIGLILAASVAIWTLREATIADTQAENHRLGVVLAEETARTLQAADSVLRELSATIEESGADDARSLHSRFGGIEVHDSLTRRLIDLPQATGFIIFDAAGNFVNDTTLWPVPDYSNLDRTYIRHFIETADTGPYISEPMVTRSQGFRVAILARRVSASNGTFLGVVMAPIRLDYFDTLLAKADLSDGTGVSIGRRDGIVLVHYSTTDVAPDQRGAPGRRWFATLAPDGGEFSSVTTFGDLGSAFVSAHPLTSYPLVVDVARAQTATLARWWRQAIVITVSVLFAALCLSLLLWALLRQIAISEASERAVRRQFDALQASEERLAMTLEHMDQGLVMVDHAGRIAVYNRRATEILDLPPDWLATHPNVAELIEFQTRRGDFSTPAEMAPDQAMLFNSDACYERRRPNGIVMEVRSMPMPDGGMVRTFTDITARAAAEAMVSLAASHDQLTGLANRNGFNNRLDSAMVAARRDSAEVAVLCLDLDRFKAVNDTLGHAVGDQVLIMVGERIRGIARAADVVCRLGGDEFAMVLPGSAVAGAELVARRLVEAIGAPYLIGDAIARIGVCIGIAIYPCDGGTTEHLLRNADTALYKAKAAGRDMWCSFGSEDGQREHRRKQLELDLRTAVELEQFTLAYQPICDAATAEPVAFEALLRWNHATRGPVSPADFVPILEQTGSIKKVGRWVIEVACAEAATWAMPMSIAVNLSPAQFRDEDLLDFIKDVLARTGLPPDRLHLEVTEGLLLDDADDVVVTMQALRAMGIRMVLDDFGTAHSNLSYLRGFPFDAVKIDRSFLRALNSDRQARALVEAMLAMARALSLDVIGEGVETEDQLSLLRLMGCGSVQGFLLGRPVPKDETRQLIWNLATRRARGEKASRLAVAAALA